MPEADASLDVLLIEDSIDDTRLTLRALRKMEPPPQAMVAVHGREALDLLYPTDGAQPKRPKLVLLDLKLPKVDGWQVLKAIRENPDTRQLPVVVLTSSNEPRDSRRAEEYGATEYVVKPGNYHEYVDAVIGIAKRYLLTVCMTLGAGLG